MSKAYDPYENVIDVMTEAMEVGHIDKKMFEIIKNPQRETKVYLPVEMDDWHCIKVFEASTVYSILIFVVLLREEFVTIRTARYQK